MALIRHIRQFPSTKSPHKPVILLCGFGGAIWQTKRLITTLNRHGYDVTALDFSTHVLSKGDPDLLLQLADEVVAFAEAQAAQTDEKILLLGISLGALMALNILRRSPLFDSGVMVTGGNIVTVAQNIYGKKVWPQSHAELSKHWKMVNMHSEPEKLVGKKMLFVLPARDKLIDTSEVIREIKVQGQAGNVIQLIERGKFGHIGTIIEETVLFPKRTLGYIEQLHTGHR